MDLTWCGHQVQQILKVQTRACACVRVHVLTPDYSCSQPGLPACACSRTHMGLLGIKCYMRNYPSKWKILHLPLHRLDPTISPYPRVHLYQNSWRYSVHLPSSLGMECYVFKNLLILYMLDQRSIKIKTYVARILWYGRRTRIWHLDT